MSIAPTLGGIQIELGTFMCAVVRKNKGGPGDCIGKICEVFEESGEHYVKVQRYARLVDMQIRIQRSVLRDAPKMLELNEIVETNEFMVLPTSNFRSVVAILSAEQFKATGPVSSGAQTFFCARALCPDGSQVLWPIDWGSSDASRKPGVSGPPEKAAWNALNMEKIRAHARRHGLRFASAISKAALIEKLLEVNLPLPGAADAAAASAASAAALAAAGKCRDLAGTRSNQPPTAFERTAAALRPGAPTSGLYCRDEERKEVYAHLRTALRQGGCKQVLYVSGMPGTGKTASLLEAVGRMGKDESIPDYTFVHINAMCLGVQHAVFSEIHRKITMEAPPGTNPFGRVVGARAVGAATAHTELTNLFANHDSNDRPIFLLVDEVDQLVTGNQAVLYRLFDWLALPNARLVIAAISNTMDLPERLLPRVASRLGVVRVNYRPYGRTEIHQILKERIKGCQGAGVFAEDALKLCAARVAAGSGDIRKALQLCRRAIELRVESNEAEGPVSIRQLDAAEKDLLHGNPAAQAVAQLSLKTRYFLLAVVLELRKRDADFISFRKATARYERMVAKRIALEVAPCSREEGAEPGSGLLTFPRHDDDAALLAARLVAMSLLSWGKERDMRFEEEAGTGPVIALGASLDVDDMANVLADVEGDDEARELLRD